MSTSTVRDLFIPSRDETRLHVVHTSGNTDAHRPCVLVVPGMLGYAADMVERIQFQRHAAFYLTLRGRGKSESARTNYRFQSHVDDVEAAAERTGSNAIALVAHSIGAVFALHYAARSASVQAVVLIDGVVGYGSFSPQWLERVRPHTTIAERELERMVADADSSNTPAIFTTIRCPVHTLVPMEGSLMCRLGHDTQCREHLPVFTMKAYPNTDHETVCSAPSSWDSLIEQLLPPPFQH